MGEIDTALSYMPVYDDITEEMCKNGFLRIKDDCYLDHAGATLYSDTQIKNVATDLQQSLYANPHSIGPASSMTQDIIEHIRYRILDHFHTSADEYSVIFTSSATASLKIIADSFVFGKNEKTSPNSVGHFVYSQDNHTSVLGMREVVAQRGAKVTCLDHNKLFKLLQSSLSSQNLCTKQQPSNSLFVYPAQCNFSGLKYPLKWIRETHNGALSGVVSESTTWYVLLDAAAFVPTNDLDLSTFKPDFVCLSFYKMFGYPTGIGALLVKKSSKNVLEKVYYGGGTVDVSLSSEMFHVKRQVLHQRFEDGTVPFLSIIALRHGFDVLSNITMKKISKHVFSLAKFLYHSLLRLHHSNKMPVVKLYSDTTYDNCDLQGGIVTFNLLRSNGEYVGYMEVLNMAALFKIHLRTGCFCNPGACQRHLVLSNQEILENFDSGYVCGGATDLINGKPTGAVRVSFGYMSTIKDVQTLLIMIRKCFVDGLEISRVPYWWADYKTVISKKYNQHNTNTKAPNKTIISDSDSISDKSQNRKDSLTHDMVGKKLSKTATSMNKFEKGVLDELYIYPVKSCAAYQITEPWILASKGLQYDREWMIVTSSGVCLTQKHNINLCLLKPVICKERNVMKLSYKEMPDIEVSLEESSVNSVEGTICKSRVCGHKVEGIDCGPEVSEWLSLALGQPNLKLVRQSKYESQNRVKHTSKISFSSQAQYLAINKASVLWLADKISDSELSKDTIVHRFRGNMIITGFNAFTETEWKDVRIGANDFLVNGPCTRCQMICIDQTTGMKTREPLHTLAEQFHGKLKFGLYLTKETEQDGTINIGDTVYATY